MKKALRWILAVVLILVLYEVIGMLVPFIKAKTVDKSYKDKIHTEDFRSNLDQACNDRARIVESNQEALDMRLSMFEEAKNSIILTTFDIRKGKSTEDIFSALFAAADRGVKVRIIVDGMYGMLHMKKDAFFYAAGSNPNIEIKYYNEPNLLMPWTIHGRMHDKYIVVDDKLLLMGGRNTFDYFLGEYKGKSTGYDREVLIYNTAWEDTKADTVIHQVTPYFEKMWESDTCKTVFDQIVHSEAEEVKEQQKELVRHYSGLKAQRQDYDALTVPVKKATFVHNPTHIYGKEPYVWEQMYELMMSAKERVTVHTPYVVCSEAMYEGFENIHQKVPDATMIVNSIASGDNVCASSDYRRNKGKLVDTGIGIYEYMGKYSTHGKSILVDDDISVVGSYNFDNRSTYVDTETMLVVDSKELNAQMQEKFDALLEQSLKVDAEGTYIKDSGVEERELPEEKERVIAILSFLIQPFRFLI